MTEPAKYIREVVSTGRIRRGQHSRRLDSGLLSWRLVNVGADRRLEKREKVLECNPL
jgi:hypothetical protein